MSTMMINDPNVAVYQGTNGANAMDSSTDVTRKIVKGVGRALELGGHSVVGVVSPVQLDDQEIVQSLEVAHGAGVFEVTHRMPDLIVLLTTGSKASASSIAIRILHVGAGNDSRVTLENSKVVQSEPAPVSPVRTAKKTTRRSVSPKSVADHQEAPKERKAPTTSSTSSSPKKPSAPTKEKTPASPGKSTRSKPSSAPATKNSTTSQTQKNLSSEDSSTRLIVAFDNDNLDVHLNSAIVEVCQEAIKARNIFTVALSGSDDLPELLASLHQVFEEQDVDPQVEKWHVVLADEQIDCSNLRALREQVFADLKVPASQIYGIQQGSPEAMAADYETCVKSVMDKSGGKLDLAILGFGSDGHTCGLFPDDANLLLEETKLVGSATENGNRITLTPPVLQKMTRHVVMCGGGPSRGAVLRNVLKTLSPSSHPYSVPRGARYNVTLEDDQDTEFYPCSMVAPLSPDSTLTWIVDKQVMDAAQGASSPY